MQTFNYKVIQEDGEGFEGTLLHETSWQVKDNVLYVSGDDHNALFMLRNVAAFIVTQGGTEDA